MKDITTSSVGEMADDDLRGKTGGINKPQPDRDRTSSSSRVLHRSLVSQPETVTSASGSYITLSTGQRILDGCTGAAVAIIGHGNNEVQAAVQEQMSKVSYAHTLAYTTGSAEALADLLLRDRPHGLCKAYFVCSGSEAMDSALKLARQYHVEAGQPQRTRIVSRRQAYHGNTVGAMSVGSNVARKAPYLDVLTLPNVSYVSPAYAYRGQREGETEEAYAARLVQELDDEFRSLGPDTVMAFVAEPMSGATLGCVTAPRGYFQGVRRLCSKYGILLILDEVMCGSGRSGTYFAFEQEGDGVYPDLLTLGKGLGGGYAPIAGVLVHEKVIDGFKSGSIVHGHTYQAHPVSCAASLAVQQVLRRDNLVQRCADKGKWLEEALRSELGDGKFIGDIRGRGFFWGLELVADRATKEPFAPTMHVASRVVQEAKNIGLAVYPGTGTADGTRGDHVIVAPPYNASDAELDDVVRLLKAAYGVVERDILAGKTS
ncbi:aminotransferase [Purpureocillium lavendulum]|uniref:Aminotransferase n=1 Tax=Purpureocillium lavendulum TaxID=1247861 RepID=A0AB34FN95_9HYPO|nr:aminotransferase [Purpureocillium lavendulum]